MPVKVEEFVFSVCVCIYIYMHMVLLITSQLDDRPTNIVTSRWRGFNEHVVVICWVEKLS
jgi:hypothetical protein